MNLTANIAKLFRDAYFGGNWTAVNMQTVLKDVTWQQATTQVQDFNTIATLVFHINYYIGVAEKVLKGEPLVGSDKEAFTHPPIESKDDWDNFLNKTWREAEDFAQLIEQLPEDMLWQDFSQNKYGNFYRNIHGIIEHLHYHLGQIVLIKKLI